MRTIAIIGGGFTGSMIAVHLLRAAGPRRVVLIERTGRPGRGLAYGTCCRDHVLNVPAGRMSAFEDRPDHFLEWARRRDAAVQGGSFLPRMAYGQYIEDVLDEAERHAPAGVTLERIGAAAIAVDPPGRDGRASVRLDSGRRIAADGVVLAVGNFPPADPPLAESSALSDPRYVRDPWDLARYAAIDHTRPVLLIGTGLTMLDVVLELAARGHRGTIHAISRRGLLPQPHRSPAKAYHPTPPGGIGLWPPTALGMLRALRDEVERAAKRGIDWREVVTSIRHDTPRLWAMLDEREKGRFLRHLRSFWEVHRHRAAPQAYAALESLMKQGRVVVSAGRLRSLRPAVAGLVAQVLPRGGQEPLELSVSAAINCTGPDTELARIADPLIASLREAGLIACDRLGLGLECDEQGAAIGSTGAPALWLRIAGPLRKGRLWETSAVPELRLQAAEVASSLLAEARPWVRLAADQPAPGAH
jgi:uncharacterized NAD(P)/FAD-binding protein YdhS